MTAPRACFCGVCFHALRILRYLLRSTSEGQELTEEQISALSVAFLQLHAFCRKAFWDKLCFLPAPYREGSPSYGCGVQPLLSPPPFQLTASLCRAVLWQPRGDLLWLFFPALLLAKELKAAGFCPLLLALFKHSAGAVREHRRPPLRLLRVVLAVDKLCVKNNPDGKGTATKANVASQRLERQLTVNRESRSKGAEGSAG